MKYNFIKLIILVFCLGIIYSACDDDKMDESHKVNLLYIDEAKQIWNGVSCNAFADIRHGGAPDTLLTVNLKLYQNHGDKRETITVDIKVDADSLAKAISMSENSTYAAFKKARLLPAKYYTIDKTQLTLEAGTESVAATIKIDKTSLLKDSYTTESEAVYVIPLRIENATKYKVNSNVSCIMYILRFPENQLDLTKPDFSDPKEIEGYTLYWNDEFNTNGKPDADNWTFESGFVRNEELQWYQSDNTICKDGALVITGKREQVSNPNYESGSGDWKKNRQHASYTSSSMHTRDKMHFKYGRLEVRAKIPTVKGAWPAIWTLGESMEWPSSGEIDVLEYYLSGGESHIHANFAWGKDARWNSHKIPFSNFLAKDPNWAEKYHVWRMDWEEDKTYMYIDDVMIREVWTNSMWNGAYGKWTNPFHQPHYMLLNLAIGSNGGDPSGSAFPIKYEVDYVRIYQKSGN